MHLKYILKTFKIYFNKRLIYYSYNMILEHSKLVNAMISFGLITYLPSLSSADNMLKVR